MMPPSPNEEQIAAYLAGLCSAQESLEIERMAVQNAAFGRRLAELRATHQWTVERGGVAPASGLKAKLFSRPEISEDPVGRDFPPYIHRQSRIEDFEPWMQAARQQLEQSEEDFECIPIGHSEDTYTFLAKMCSTIPQEVHTQEIERVLVVSGSCEFVVGESVFDFGPGDGYTIPLHTPHSARRVSAEPCIFLLQRTLLPS